MNQGGIAIKILLIDDQRIIGEALKRMVESEPDMQFLHCDDPAGALKAALDFSPSIILQDLVMPGVDGLDLLKAYKAEPKLKDVPVIVLSSEEDSEIKLKAFSLRASDYMVKIPNRVELLSRIREHAKGGICLRRLAAAEAELCKMKDVIASAAWLTAAYAASSFIARDLETPVQYVGGNMMFIHDAFSSLTRFRVRLTRLDIPKDIQDAMKEAADKEDLDFVFEDAPKALRQSQDEVARAASMLGVIRSIPLRQGLAETELVDVNSTLRESADFLKNRIGAVADFKVELAPSLPKVRGRLCELRMAFILLLAGAVSAVEERFGHNAKRGLVQIGTSMLGSEVVITIQDDGSPISKELLNALCDPLYGISPSGLSARRGLHPVKLIVESSGGGLAITPLPEAGCSIALHLPSAS